MNNLRGWFGAGVTDSRHRIKGRFIFNGPFVSLDQRTGCDITFGYPSLLTIIRSFNISLYKFLKSL